MAVSSYSEKLRDPRWQKKRLEIMERDLWTCQKCWSNEKTLTVHHRFYLRGKEPWDYPFELLVTICDGCHKEEHDLGEAELIKLLKFRGFFNSDLHSLVRKIQESDDSSVIEWFYDGLQEIHKRNLEIERLQSAQ
jgi:5-methylcytosine-specific restriction endonuclease McrA